MAAEITPPEEQPARPGAPVPHPEAVPFTLLIEEHVRCQLSGRVRDFQVVLHNGGLILRGHAHSPQARQLAQHAVEDITSLPVTANEIEVS